MKDFIIIFLLFLGFVTTLGTLNTIDNKNKYIDVLQDTIRSLDHPVPVPKE